MRERGATVDRDHVCLNGNKKLKDGKRKSTKNACVYSQTDMGLGGVTTLNFIVDASCSLLPSMGNAVSGYCTVYNANAVSPPYKGQRIMVIPAGAVTTTTMDWDAGTPSAYPRALSSYVAQLQKVNATPENRVDSLERELKEIRYYLPTIKKLVGEFASASMRVSAVVNKLGRKHDPAAAWDIALQKDVLTGPIDDDEYSEIL